MTIPARPTSLVGNISLLIEHEHAVAVRAVEALKGIRDWPHQNDERVLGVVAPYDAEKALDDIEASGWKP